MEDYEELYNLYRSKYYNACNEVNACERAIATMQEQRRSTVNRINEINARVKKTNGAISNMQSVLNREDEVTEKLTEVSNKLDLASVNYSGMVSSSDVSNKNLTDMFSGETTATGTAINSVFDTVRSRKASLETTVFDMQTELNNANYELSGIDSRIRSEKSSLSEWKREKNNSYYYMEYYKRKMQETDW